MTVIVALKAVEGLWIGSDRLVASGKMRYPWPQLKWRRLGEETWAGIAGPMIILDLLSDYQGSIAAKGLVPVLLDAVAEMKRRYDAADIPQGERGNVTMISVVGKNIYETDILGSSVAIEAPPWCAFGSGGPEARGALHALYATDPERPGRDMMEYALRAACDLDGGCGNGMFIERAA